MIFLNAAAKPDWLELQQMAENTLLYTLLEHPIFWKNLKSHDWFKSGESQNGGNIHSVEVPSRRAFYQQGYPR